MFVRRIHVHYALEQVADIEEKLDILIKAYMSDRERLYSLPHVPELQHSIHTTRQPPPSGGAGCGIVTGGPSTSGGIQLKVRVERHSDEVKRNETKFYVAQTDSDRQATVRGSGHAGCQVF